MRATPRPVLRHPSPHAQRLERWLGPETLAHLSACMAPWYGPPIGVAQLPGAIYAHAGGDFSGQLAAHRFSTHFDVHVHRIRCALRRFMRRQGGTARTGFSSFSDLLAEYTAGKRVVWPISKSGSTRVTGGTNSLWGLGSQPAAGANASNAPGGDAPTDATTGALAFTNPSGGDTLHYLAANILGSAAGCLLLYDRLFQVNKTMASTATEAVTGVPSRYTSTTGGAADSAEGNFLFVEVGGTALAATAHNWTTCQYTDQSGNTAVNLPSLTGNSGAIVRRLDHPLQQWFAPLATGDTGIKALTQMQCSASVATGVINFVIGHPIAWIPLPTANVLIQSDGLRGPLNLARIFDDAALALLEPVCPGTAANTYTGMIEAVFG